MLTDNFRFESTYKELKLKKPYFNNYELYSFESTYKELKPIYRISCFYMPFCFESTYKELKHQCKAAGVPVFVKSFESTYKELKQGYKGNDIGFAKLVLSLPIRN